MSAPVSSPDPSVSGKGSAGNGRYGARALGVQGLHLVRALATPPLLRAAGGNLGAAAGKAQTLAGRPTRSRVWGQPGRLSCGGATPSEQRSLPGLAAPAAPCSSLRPPVSVAPSNSSLGVVKASDLPPSTNFKGGGGCEPGPPENRRSMRAIAVITQDSPAANSS